VVGTERNLRDLKGKIRPVDEIDKMIVGRVIDKNG
jgi:hypothetical protein